MYCKLIPALTNTTMLKRAYLNTSKRILDWQGIKQDLNLVGAYDLKWSQKHWVLWIVDWISTEFYFSHFYLFRENSGKQKEIGSLESQVYRLVELVGVLACLRTTLSRVAARCSWWNTKERKRKKTLNFHFIQFKVTHKLTPTSSTSR